MILNGLVSFTIQGYNPQNYAILIRRYVVFVQSVSLNQLTRLGGVKDNTPLNYNFFFKKIRESKKLRYLSSVVHGLLNKLIRLQLLSCLIVMGIFAALFI